MRIIKILVPVMAAFIFFHPVPVMAATADDAEIEAEGSGGGGQHDVDDPGNSGGGGGHHDVTDTTLENIIKPYLVILDNCRTKKIYIGSYSFTIFDVWMYEILIGIVVWFIWYKLYY
ncbi:MAG: hypothetical protein J6K58_04755 [Lachnospiraceae bacterium]|nr:hypothetical protein [Lachnospiraceae bacterium]